MLTTCYSDRYVRSDKFYLWRSKVFFWGRIATPFGCLETRTLICKLFHGPLLPLAARLAQTQLQWQSHFDSTSGPRHSIKSSFKPTFERCCIPHTLIFSLSLVSQQYLESLPLVPSYAIWAASTRRRYCKPLSRRLDVMSMAMDGEMYCRIFCRN